MQPLPPKAGNAGFQITNAVVQTDALTLSSSASSSASATVTSAAVEIKTHHPCDALPADLLSGLGWDWALLRHGVQGWQGSMRLRGRGGSRGNDAVHKLHLAAAHLS